ncbi:MAG: imidazole glycerol phosphate synthase subunit HisH [Methylophilaceae bacterium]|jgi:imidazole glycerol-phosphate synthase subunit HisH|nr:imidazole glycerol phosphate synthase subunit HisH [Methylophilaceae bacterium]
MITIIDYGLGNIQAFINIYKKLHIPVHVAKSEDDLDGASKLILPGVGHFDYAMQRFNDSGMREKSESLILNSKVPVLGICVGMQIMANSSEEGVKPGLGWINGTVKSFKSILKAENNLPLPHMGWNTIVTQHNDLINHIDSDLLKFYFLHSYFFNCTFEENSIAHANYGSNFCCAINNGNIYGVQFHPEKSHDAGISLLKSFAELDKC